MHPTPTAQFSHQREPIEVPSLPSSSQHKPQTDTVPRRITRNVPIEIIEPDELTPEPKGSIDFLKPIQSRVLSPSNPSPSVPPAHKSQPRVGAAIFRADGSHTILRPPTSSSIPSAASAPMPAPAFPSASAMPSNTSAPVSQPQLTHLAFSRTWHALPTPQERYSFLLVRLPNIPSYLTTFFSDYSTSPQKRSQRCSKTVSSPNFSCPFSVHSRLLRRVRPFLSIRPFFVHLTQTHRPLPHSRNNSHNPHIHVGFPGRTSFQYRASVPQPAREGSRARRVECYWK